MPSTCASPPPTRFRPAAAQSHLPDPHDEDDGIHIVSAIRVDRPGGAVLSVVVSWFEEGRWVKDTVELPD